jgi:outer membrane protein assembly factor BamB
MKRAAQWIWLGLAVSQLLSATEPSWPQFRGPNSQGVSPEKGLPFEWSNSKNIAWKASIPGSGHSSPIISGNRIFLTTAIEGPVIPGAKAVRHSTKDGGEFLHPDSVGADRHQVLRLLCFDLASGKLLWERVAYEGRVKDNRHKKNTFASPTPVTDGRYVYAYFGSEGLYCFDLDGKLVWQASLGLIATMGIGVASSPVLYGDLVIVQCDQDNGQGSFVVAVKKANGRIAWKVARTALESWSTPLVVRHKNRDELIVNAREIVISYDPETGKEYWRMQGVGVNPAPSPVAGHELVFITAGAQEKRTVAVRPGGTGDVTGSAHVVWRYDRGAPHVPSPLLYGDYLYLLTDNGLLTCLEARTGKVMYPGARPPVPATFTASPVAFENKLLLTSEEGDTYVVQAGPEYRLLQTNPIGEPVYASPAIAGGRILIRGEKNLYCIKK